MKIIALILSLSTIFCFSSCKNNDVYHQKISQLRQTILFAENDDFLIFAYPETCENPQIDDGVKRQTENKITFKLQVKDQNFNFENGKIEFSINDKSYKINFDYSTISSFFYCSLAVDTLPSDNLYLTVFFNDKNAGLSLSSLKNATTLSPEKTLKTLEKQDDFVKNFLKDDSGEIKVRFIDNDGFDYWYLGFTTSQKTTSYLVDGETCEILAIKHEK